MSRLESNCCNQAITLVIDGPCTTSVILKLTALQLSVASECFNEPQIQKA